MSFPLAFVQPRKGYEVISDIANISLNAAVLVVGKVILDVIAVLALKTLGFGNVATRLVTVFPVGTAVISALGTGTAAAGTLFLAGLLVVFLKSFRIQSLD